MLGLINEFVKVVGYNISQNHIHYYTVSMNNPKMISKFTVISKRTKILQNNINPKKYHISSLKNKYC